MIIGMKCGRNVLLNISTISFKESTSVVKFANVFPSVICRCLQNVNRLASSKSRRTIKHRLSVEPPKSILSNIYNVVCQKLGSNEWKPSFHCSALRVAENSQGLWKATLTLRWPTLFVEEGIASKKKTAEAIAAKKALERLHQQKVLDENGCPILYSKEEKKALIKTWNVPCPITIKSNVEESLQNLLNDYIEIESELSCSDKLIWEPRFNKENDESVKHPSEIVDIITGEKCREVEQETLDFRNYFMYVEMKEKEASHDYCKFKESRQLLPITSRREDILSLIRDNSVIVLSGETGCGKTTQVPQFILDEYIYSLNGSNCNMVVTQPRRLSAISIAHRIAKERCQKLGETVGFQVRLEKKVPTQKGAVLLCTTGILLRRLQSNPYLEGISHIIVDEVHERSIEIDILLTLLKMVVERNKKVKIILMSATINADVFSKYFDNCPVINISGFTYPVKQYFLEDVYSILQRKMPIPTAKGDDDDIDFDLVTDLICKIDSDFPDGAILCFLPGWQEIKTVNDRLLELSDSGSRLTIYPLHSVLPQHKQALVFEPASAGKRKVILATNIAETSITINDVVYVIDSGYHKELTYSSDRGISVLLTNYISKANVQQRKGRAGRVQPGECFHLFTKEDNNNMQEFPVPEILRASLENVVLDSKVYCPEESAVKFLSASPEPPPIKNVEQAVKNLQVLDILDNEENLTALGRRATYLSTHPRLSKAVIYSVIFRCLNPVLTIAAMLSANRSPFDVGIEDRKAVREIKEKYNTSYPSDLLSFANLFKEWDNIASDSVEESTKFCVENKLNLQIMKFIQGMKDLLLEQLIEAKLIRKTEKTEGLSSVFNEYSSNELMVLSVLSSAFYPNLFRVKRGTLERGRIKEGKHTFTTLDGKHVMIPSDSIVSKLRECPSEFIASFAEIGFQRRTRIVKENSVIPALIVLVCTGRNIRMVVKENTGFLEIDGKSRLTFSAPVMQCEMLMMLRACFNKIVQWSLCNLSENSSDTLVNGFIDEFMKTFVALLEDNLEESDNIHKDFTERK